MSQNPEDFGNSIRVTSTGHQQSSNGRHRSGTSSNNQRSETIFAWEPPKDGDTSHFAMAHRGPPGTEPSIFFDGKPVELKTMTGRKSITAASATGQRSIAAPSQRSVAASSKPSKASSSQGHPELTLQKLHTDNTAGSRVKCENTQIFQSKTLRRQPSQTETLESDRLREVMPDSSWIDEAARRDGQHGIPQAMYDRVNRYWDEKNMKDIYDIQEVINKKYNFQMSIWTIYGILQFDAAMKSAPVDKRPMMPPQSRPGHQVLVGQASKERAHIRYLFP